MDDVKREYEPPAISGPKPITREQLERLSSSDLRELLPSLVGTPLYEHVKILLGDEPSRSE